MAINKVIYGGNTLIDLTGDTVSASRILSGTTAHDKAGNLIIGTCSYDANTSDATAMASEILSGKTAYKGGSKITGTMTNRGAGGGSIETKGDSIPIPSGYYDGSGSVSIKASEANKIIPGNIKEGVSILGVNGTLKVGSIFTQLAFNVPVYSVHLGNTPGETYMPRVYGPDNYTYGLACFQNETELQSFFNILKSGDEYSTTSIVNLWSAYYDMFLPVETPLKPHSGTPYRNYIGGIVDGYVEFRTNNNYTGVNIGSYLVIIIVTSHPESILSPILFKITDRALQGDSVTYYYDTYCFSS